MANKTVEILLAAGQTGLTIDLYQWGSDTRINGSGDTLTEETNRKGLYTATVTEAITGMMTAHVFNGSTLITAADLYIPSDAVGVYRAGAFAYADMIRLNGKRTDATPSQNDRPKLWLSGMDIRNSNGAGLEITTPAGNGIYVYSETEAVWFESVESAALELLGGPYGIFVAANDNPNTSGAPIVYQTVDTSRPFVSIASGTASMGFESSIWSNATRTLTAGSMVITPIVASVSNPFYATRDLPKLPAASANVIIWTIVNAMGEAVTLTGKTCRLVAYLTTSEGEDDTTEIDDSITASFQYATGGDGLVVGGADNNQITLAHSITKTATAGEYRYMLWNITDNTLLAKGKMPIVPSVKGS